MRSSRPLTLLVGLAVAVASVPPALATVGPTDEQVAEAQDRATRLEREVTDARAELGEVESRLDALDQELAAANAATAIADEVAGRAERAAADARARARRTAEELAAANRDLDTNRQVLDDAVRDAFMYGGQASSTALAAAEQLGEAGSLADVADSLHLVEVVIGDRGVAVEDTEALVVRSDQLLRATRAAEEAATAEAAAASAALEAAATRSAEVLSLVDRTDQLVRRQQELLAGLREDAAAAEREVATLEEEARAAAEAARAAVRAEELGGGLVRVGGITVAASLAPSLEDLLEAARADGIELAGFGYRSPETTARLRQVNGCPDVDTSPPSSCRVPTARPGESMHEQGLAIDFTWQGQTLCYPRSAAECSGNAAFDWLAANAARFGLQVLDTEAWHWSTNGR